MCLIWTFSHQMSFICSGCLFSGVFSTSHDFMSIFFFSSEVVSMSGNQAAIIRHVSNRISRVSGFGIRLSVLNCRKDVLRHVVRKDILLNDTSEVDDRRIIVFRSFTPSFAALPFVVLSSYVHLMFEALYKCRSFHKGEKADFCTSSYFFVLLLPK